MKQKFFKTLITVVMILIAATLVLNNVFAAVTSESGASITIANLEEGVTVKIYQIANIVWDDTLGTYGDEIYEWANTNIATYMLNAGYETPEDLSDAIKDSSDASKTFYVAMLEAISKGDLEITAVGTQTVAEGSNSVTFSGYGMGTYLVEITGGVNVYSPLVVNVEPTYDSDTKEWTLATTFEVDAKYETLTLTHETETTTTSTYSYIYYEVTADIPTYLDEALAKNYSITVALDNGLTYNENEDIEVYVGGELLTSSEDDSESYDYKLEYTYNTDGEINGFVITFEDYSVIKDQESVVVDYSAYLEAGSTDIVGANSSTATLTYSNNPYSSATETGTVEAIATVYSYGIEIIKVDKKAQDTGLAGAKFTVTDGTNTLYFTGSNGVYYLSHGTTGVTELEVADDGTLYIYGLDLGDYVFTETQAPDGYILSSTTTTVSLVDEDEDGLLEDSEGIELESSIYTAKITNSSGFSLPSTGSIGTTIFTICGAILMVAGVFVIVTRIKRNN